MPKLEIRLNYLIYYLLHQILKMKENIKSNHLSKITDSKPIIITKPQKAQKRTIMQELVKKK